MTKTKSIAKQEFIERAIPGLDAMIPQAQKRAGTINGPQLARALLVCIKKGKNMDKIPPTDILLAGSACASMGLIPGDTGQAYIWASRTKEGRYVANVSPGYKGLLIVLRRLGWSIKGACVFKDDNKFEIELGTETNRILHIPNPTAEKSAKTLVAAWVAAKNINTEELIVPRPVSKKEIEERIESAPKGSPWKDQQHLETMAMKTAIRRLTQIIAMDTADSSMAARLNEKENEPIRTIQVPTTKEIAALEEELSETKEEEEVEVEVAEIKKYTETNPKTKITKTMAKIINGKISDAKTDWHYIRALLNIPQKQIEDLTLEEAENVRKAIEGINQERKQ